MSRYKRIIFVGKSGTVREPMAMGILKTFSLKEPVEVFARGLVVQFPEPMNQKTEAILVSKNIRIPGFSSSQIKKEDLTGDTLILTMEARDRKRLLENFPNADPENVYVLADFVGEELETVDPYGMALANYGLCYENLLRSIRKLVQILEEDEEK